MPRFTRDIERPGIGFLDPSVATAPLGIRTCAKNRQRCQERNISGATRERTKPRHLGRSMLFQLGTQVSARISPNSRLSFRHESPASVETYTYPCKVLATMMFGFCALVPNQYTTEFGSTGNSHFAQVLPPSRVR